MDFQFYFKKMQSSEALKKMATKKISERIAKYANPSQKVHITFFQDGIYNSLHCSLSTDSGARLYAEASSENMYNAIDIVANKLQAQFQRRKTKLKSHSKKFNPSKDVFMKPVRKLDPIPMALQPSVDIEIDFIDAGDIVKWEAAIAPYREQMRLQLVH